MILNLSDLISSDVADVFINTADFAVSATISRLSQSITIGVIIDTEQIRTGNQEMEIARQQTVALASVSDYTLGEPSGLDRITVSSTEYHAVTPEGKGQCWEYADSTRTMFRIWIEEV